MKAENQYPKIIEWLIGLSTVHDIFHLIGHNSDISLKVTKKQFYTMEHGKKKKNKKRYLFFDYIDSLKNK